MTTNSSVEKTFDDVHGEDKVMKVCGSAQSDEAVDSGKEFALYNASSRCLTNNLSFITSKVRCYHRLGTAFDGRVIV